MPKLTREQKRSRELTERASRARASTLRRAQPGTRPEPAPHVSPSLPEIVRAGSSMLVAETASLTSFDVVLRHAFDDRQDAWFAFAPERVNGKIIGGTIITVYNVDEPDDAGVQVWAHAGRFGVSSGTEASAYMHSMDDFSGYGDLGIDPFSFKFLRNARGTVNESASCTTEHALVLLHVGAKAPDAFDGPLAFASVPGWEAWLTMHETG